MRIVRFCARRIKNGGPLPTYRSQNLAKFVTFNETYVGNGCSEYKYLGVHNIAQSVCYF